ncbi:MAG: hypothetical protein ACE5G1_00915 [bacterium]
MNKVYTMADLADKESSIILADDGRLLFEVNADLDNYYIGDELKIDGMQDVFSMSLGSFSVDSPTDVVTSVILSEIFSPAIALHGQTVVVPPFSFQTSQKVLDPYDSFSYVIVESGSISLHVVNNLAVPLGSPLTLEIWDTNQNTLISSTTNSTQIPAGGSSDFVIDLAGKRIPNQLSIAMSGSSPGSSGAAVLVDKNSTFSITTSISNLAVAEALAEVPAQVFSGEEQVSVTDSVVIIDAKIETGSINVSVTGSFPLDVTLTYELPDFISPAGVPLTGTIFLPRNSTQNIPISLLNYSLQPQSADFGQQKIRFLWQASTAATEPNMVLLKNNDSISAILNISTVKFYQLSGKFSQKAFDIQQNDIEFDIPADLDSLFFETARLELSINNGINFPANIELTIEGQNESGATAVMAINESIQPATAPGVPVTSVIVLDQQNSNIKDFIRILPNLLRVSGKVIVGDTNLPGTVSEDDFVSGSVKVTAPFTLKLTPQTIETDAIELDIDENVRNDIIKHLADGSLSMEIINHLPVGASVQIVFSQNETDLYQNPALEITAIRADAASVDGSGTVQSAVTSDNQIGLTQEQMRTFLLTPLHAGLRISLDGTSDKFVMFNSSDYIRVKSFTSVNVTVNQD